MTVDIEPAETVVTIIGTCMAWTELHCDKLPPSLETLLLTEADTCQPARQHPSEFEKASAAKLAASLKKVPPPE